jgi:hypothetical protein
MKLVSHTRSIVDRIFLNRLLIQQHKTGTTAYLRSQMIDSPDIPRTKKVRGSKGVSILTLYLGI